MSDQDENGRAKPTWGMPEQTTPPPQYSQPIPPPQPTHFGQPPYGGPPPGYPPQQAGYGPQPGYGEQPQPMYQPYGPPRKSRMWLWIGIAFGVILVVGLVIRFAFPNSPWGRRIGSTSYSSGASPSSSGLVGRWCVRQGSTQFNADGSFSDSAGGSGAWQEVSPGRVNMTANARTIAASYRVSGNTLDLTSAAGAVRYTRC